MTTTDSTELLRCYASEKSEAAFAALVRQHVDLVYSAALRQVGDSQIAQDVTQAVFTDLARKAHRLTRHTSLAGWLYTSTRYLAANARRTEQRRRSREQEAHTMNQLLQAADCDPVWNELRPVLDEAMHELGAADREAVLLRFFERCPLAKIGTRFGLTENAARMRVERALDKLRIALAKRGVTSTAAALAGILTANAAMSAPTGLASKVSHGAFVAGSVGGLFAFLSSVIAPTKVKLLVGGAMTVTVAALLWLQRSPDETRDVIVTSMTVEPGETSEEASSAATDITPPVVIASPAAPAISTSNRLVLKIVSAESDQPLPSVALDYWLWGGKGSVHKKPLHADQLGVCEVPVPRDTVTQLILVSQVDGYADTRLEWRPERGEQIPEEYTLRVARSVPIGGLVVDPDGQPVTDAEVAFGNTSNPGSETRPQSDDFGWPFHVRTTTDADGRWRIDRIAGSAISTISGSANHSNYVSSRVDLTGRDSETERQLRAGTCVFRLGRAAVVSGVVVDANGQPVTGAKITVGHVGESGRRETTALPDGNFSVAGCRPGKNLLSAEAKGFAPTTLDVELSDNSGPFTLTLQRGGLLRLRVVDQSGQPVPKTTVWLNPFERGPIDPTGKTRSPVQTEFSRQTDADGRLEWDSAPDADLRFDMSAPGYMRVSDVLVRPDGEEHTIVLPSALTISGTVRDAATGQPIPRFRIITGWPMDNSTNAQWSSIDRFWLSFEGGKFRHVYEEPVVGGTRNPGFMFKFEADGYAAFLTRPVRADEGEVQFDIALKTVATVSVTVVQPDGLPAARADVGLVSPGSGLRLVPGGFSRQNVQSGGSLLTADTQGQFVLPPDDAVTLVIAASAAGYAEASPAVLSSDPIIHLQPWGRIEGNYVASEGSVVGRSLLFTCKQGNIRTVSSDFMAYQTKTDDTGRFSFSQVPPGKHSLVELVAETGYPGGKVWTHRPLAEVEIRPGETTTITVGQADSLSKH